MGSSSHIMTGGCRTPSIPKPTRQHGRGGDQPCLSVEFRSIYRESTGGHVFRTAEGSRRNSRFRATRICHILAVQRCFTIVPVLCTASSCPTMGACFFEKHSSVLFSTGDPPFDDALEPRRILPKIPMRCSCKKPSRLTGFAVQVVVNEKWLHGGKDEGQVTQRVITCRKRKPPMKNSLVRRSVGHNSGNHRLASSGGSVEPGYWGYAAFSNHEGISDGASTLARDSLGRTPEARSDQEGGEFEPQREGRFNTAIKNLTKPIETNTRGDRYCSNVWSKRRG
ncbi:hypothetical protein BS47DRAFT_1383420 [Hydnum rufescens UP504]|uniref:Uncharacterized protein n=1 Tax=Hydnum rufescens UP504 TaxID=1448309 RepID=A0A9P6AVE9_9AGAM|nr:hypothetical protein BS47DRAFT_1383420 [Hydnum rufescens UP504]